LRTAFTLSIALGLAPLGALLGCEGFDCNASTCAAGCCQGGKCYEGTGKKGGGACELLPGWGGGWGGFGGGSGGGGGAGVPSDGGCVPAGAACTTSNQCCSGTNITCSQGACQLSTCGTYSDPCNAAEPCCINLTASSGYNTGYVCVNERCAFCGARGNDCSSKYDYPCCPGLSCQLKPGYSTIYECR
jgi:hypothetical protein